MIIRARLLACMTIEQEAKSNFNSGYNCAESVLLVVSKSQNPVRHGVESVIPRIATGFGGGVSRNGDICGAVAGATMAISLAFGRDRPEESRERCYQAVDRLYSDFVKTFGTCRCRELTGIDLKNQAGREAEVKRIHLEVCNPIVAWTTKRTQEIIQETR
jgi:C_GCAxxG_C_C family probable redox protein